MRLTDVTWRAGLVLPACLVCLILAALNCYAGSRVNLQNGSLSLAGKPFLIRAVAYQAAEPGPVAPPCAHARDLPLIAVMGANTVRTRGLLSDDDRGFPELLESTGLYWLADFPLEPYYDPSRPLSSQKERILDDFRAYAGRFKGQPHLIGYIFGSDVAQNYKRKFAGSPADFRALVAEAAKVLDELEPESQPLLTTATADTSELAANVAGLSFWIWDGVGVPEHASAPLLLAANSATAESDEAQASEAARLALVAEQEQRPLARAAGQSGNAQEPQTAKRLGAIYADFYDALFRADDADGPGRNSLHARPIFYTLAGLWDGTYPAAWADKDAPHLLNLQAWGVFAPGTVIGINGRALTASIAPYTDEQWPFSLGTSCLCVGGLPARLSRIASGELDVQLPTGLESGEKMAVFFRAGQASNPLPIRIGQFSAGPFLGPVLEAVLTARPRASGAAAER